MSPRFFDLKTSELAGTNLIEASAGTGKTYAIAGLFLRLIVEKGFSVDQILTVTFTVAATEELRDRIRNKLRDAREAFLCGGSETDELLDHLAKTVKNANAAAARVEAELHRFDEAAIFTIHGFCRQTLQENAFESGAPFDSELEVDQDAFMQEVVDDFWRLNFFDGELPVVCAAMASGLEPKILSGLLADRSRHPLTKVVPEISPSEADRRTAHFSECWKRAQAVWPKVKDEVCALLTDKANRLSKSVKNYKPELVKDLLDALDEALNEKPNPECFEAFEKFAASSLNDPAVQLKKGFAPEHPFFDLCQEIVEAEDALITALKVRFLAFAEQELARKKALANVQGFGDLLTRLHSAVKGAGGTALVKRLREKYKAALIDEFQDTDPLQYEIFDSIFAGAPSSRKEAAPPVPLLFLIGDPKQAIYGFRGADVFAYLKAAERTEKTYTLGKNYRSPPKLLTAVNKIFAGANPFILNKISFPGVSSPEGRVWERLSMDGQEPAPFTIWFVRRTDENTYQGRIKKKWAETCLPRATAAQIADLLNKAARGKVLLGDRALEAGDIAVLVRKNSHAALVQAALRELSVPSVIYTADNLFKTREASETARILAAMADPGNYRAVGAAIATDALGTMGNEFYRLRENEAGWELWIQRFRECRDLWDRRGFLPMFRRLLSELHVRERLLEFNDGERRLTNFLHLSEVLHKAAVEEKLGISGLLKWLAQKRNSDAAISEEHELRLESDEKAVKLVTVHRSKGLEFPVVFCPFSWEGKELSLSKNGNNAVAAHAKADGGTMALDLGSADLEEHVKRANLETLAEEARLLYVALTRAKSSCCLVWGAFKSSDFSAPAYLLHKSQPKNQVKKQPRNQSKNWEDAFSATKARFAEIKDEEMLADLSALVEPGILEAVELPGQLALAGQRYQPPAEQPQKLEAKKFTGTVDRSWRLSSFTALTSKGGAHAASSRGVTLDAARDTTDPEAAGKSGGADLEPRGFSLFPKAPRPEPASTTYWNTWILPEKPAKTSKS